MGKKGNKQQTCQPFLGMELMSSVLFPNSCGGGTEYLEGICALSWLLDENIVMWSDDNIKNQPSKLSQQILHFTDIELT